MKLILIIIIVVVCYCYIGLYFFNKSSSSETSMSIQSSTSVTNIVADKAATDKLETKKLISSLYSKYMLILGNMYNQDDSLWVIVLSSTEIDGYKYFKKTKIVDDIVIYQYKIKIDNENKNIQIGYKTITFSNVKPQLNNTSVYFVSCDGQNTKIYNFSNPIKVYNALDDTDMWKKLYLDIKADTNLYKYVIHLGDQVYMDDAHNELINNNTTNDTYTVRRTYYDVYNLNYNNKYKKKVLRNAYNVMIGDDHEIISNYRTTPNNLTQIMLDNLKDMYKIFQEDLYGVEDHNIKHLVFKDFQIIIPDLRKYRQPITDNITKYPIMGETQMKEFDDIVKNTQSEIKRTYYVSSIPLVGVDKKLDKLISIISGNTDVNKDDYISSNNYLTERNYIINKLFELDNVVVIGGDYHYAEYYTFVKNGKTIKQITTSPISSDPLILQSPWYKKAIGWILTNLLYDKTIDNITINKEWFIFDYNYLKTTNKNAFLCCYKEDNSKSIAL
jgi:hypothetical protein